MPFRVVIHTGYDYPEYHAVMEEVRAYLVQTGLECEVIPMISDWSPQATVQCTRGFQAALASHELWTRPVFEELSGQLCFVCKLGTGMDTFDLEAAEDHGVTVANAWQANSSAVADMTVALMLAANRRVAHIDRMVRSGVWWTAHLSGQLEGATVGLIGFGGIARIVRRYLTGFGCRVLAYSRSARPGPNEELQVEFVSLDTLARESDFVSVHVPLHDSTRGMIDSDFFAKMKPSALFFNTSRGPIVREKDLIAALRNGVIAGAGLDVYESEPLQADNPLLAMDNVVLSTHVAGNTLPAVRRVGRMAADRVIEYAAARRVTINGRQAGRESDRLRVDSSDGS
ncbi:MAG: 3-phosphoglycerate dehydrogenase [Spirochaetaceae bacterium]|nr:MAG: 3-phosphoglycerate dehydrogenase [Spirochaetaceae bacterium]